MSRELRKITASRVDAEAAKVVRRLVRFGYEAYLVGGCVRDLLLDRQPKDYDVSTNATPTEIKKVFRNCRIIGRRFRLAHIFFGRKIIETSTFRAAPSELDEPDAEGQILWRDNVFGSAEEDAQRRDFTINGLFYDLVNERVIDNVGGIEDLQAGQVRAIGDPLVRLQEDPVRILRAIKFAARLEMRVAPATWEAMIVHAGQVALCSPARVLEEVYRLLGSGCSVGSFELMRRAGVLPVLFPELAAVLDAPRTAGAAAPRLAMGGHEPPAGKGKPQAEAAEARALAQQSQRVDRLLELLGVVEDERRGDVASATWAHLEALDVGLRKQGEAPSHALLLGALLLPLLEGVLMAESRLGQTIERVDTAVDGMTTRLHVSRKDKERLKQILVAQRRLVYSRPRAQLVSRDFFQDAFSLLLLRQAVSDDPARGEIIGAWRGLMRGAPKRPRRRRRSGRKIPPGRA